MENDDLARRTGLIGACRILKSITGKLPDETVTARLGELFKEQQVTPVLNVITDCEVSSYELHISDLAFAGIREHSVRTGSITISILIAGFPSEEKN